MDNRRFGGPRDGSRNYGNSGPREMTKVVCGLRKRLRGPVQADRGPPCLLLRLPAEAPEASLLIRFGNCRSGISLLFKISFRVCLRDGTVRSSRETRIVDKIERLRHSILRTPSFDGRCSTWTLRDAHPCGPASPGSTEAFSLAPIPIFTGAGRSLRYLPCPPGEVRAGPGTPRPKGQTRVKGSRARAGPRRRASR